MSKFENEILENRPILNIPISRVRLKRVGSILKIFDCIRNKFVALTPEEYVRQQFSLWMINSLGYPRSLISNEVSLNLNGTKRRCDTVVFNPDGSILIIVEYKAPDVVISQDVFDQIMRYNLVLKAQFLIVSNGYFHYCCCPDYIKGTYTFLEKIPEYRIAKEFVRL